MKSAIIITAILIVSYSLGATYSFGQTVKVQREQGSAIQIENRTTNEQAGNIMTPKSMSSKDDFKTEDTSRFTSETMIKYRKPAEGEGEKKK